MKTLIILVLITSAFAFSQTVSDSMQTKNRNQEKEQIKNQNGELNQVQTQTGPKQNPQSEMKENRKKKDVFIDKDGDGICDTRQSGMSFNKMRKRNGTGKNGPGGSGNGNNGRNGNGGN